MMALVAQLVGFGLLISIAAGTACAGPASVPLNVVPSSLERTNLYLAAGDYRRALEVCQREIDEAPSAASYVYLTYVYQAIDAYLEHLSREERWVAVEQLYLNLAYRDTEDLVDQPGGLARMAKEMIQTSVRQQADVSAAMAARLDKAESERLWVEQARWRTANPKTWWQGIPTAWGIRRSP
jgi:hypothetical protein